MGIISFHQASSKDVRLIINVYGESESGKTLTALLLARGIAGPDGKVLGIDTESGRMSLYADEVPGGYMVGELSPPFNPDRYRAAFSDAMALKPNVIVLDSASHAWEGIGGVLDQADQIGASSNNRDERAKWAKPKLEYQRMISAILSSGVHVVFCSRGKCPLEFVTENGRKKAVRTHVVPIQDARLRFEFTVVLPMLHHGTYSMEPGFFKAPGKLLHLFDGKKPPTVALGAEIARIMQASKQIDHDLERLRMAADNAASNGTESYLAFWKAASKEDRARLLDGHDNRKSAAAAADAQAKEIAQQAAMGDDDFPGDFQAGTMVAFLDDGKDEDRLAFDLPDAAPDFVTAFCSVIDDTAPAHRMKAWNANSAQLDVLRAAGCSDEAAQIEAHFAAAMKRVAG